MDVMIDLHSVSDRLLDNQVVQLAWMKKEGRLHTDPIDPNRLQGSSLSILR